MIQIHKNYKLIEKYWGGHDLKWVWPPWSHVTKIGCIPRRNQWNKMIFGVLIKFRDSEKSL